MMNSNTAQEDGHGASAELGWFALSVRSRHEFVVRDELLRKGVHTFLPSMTKLQQWRDRKKQVVFPVFPGYLFVHIVPGPEDFLQVLKTRGAACLVSLQPGHPTPVPAEEIEALKKVLESGRHFDVYPGYRMGARVRIRRGPLQGAEGVLVSREEMQLFFVNVEILGRSVGVKLSGDDMELTAGTFKPDRAGQAGAKPAPARFATYAKI
jgi:transcription antitermination factor NusG